MKRWTLIILFVLLAMAPFLFQFDPYLLSFLSKLYINAILAISLWPLFIIGRLTLGHGAFYGLGAYGVSLLMLKLGMSFWLALPIALILVAIVAVAFSFPSLRINGAYFAMATFAFSEMLRLVYLRFDGLFGGAQGLFNIPKVTPITVPYLPTLSFVSQSNQYYLVLASLAVACALYYRYVHSHLGLTMRSIHDAHNLAQALGVNVFAFQMATFILSAVGAAFAGALYAGMAGYLDPNLFGIPKSIEAQAYVIIGGAGFAIGPILGAAFMTALPEYLNLARETAPIITGLALIVTMLVLRGGLVTLPDVLAHTARKFGWLSITRKDPSGSIDQRVTVGEESLDSPTRVSSKS